MNMFYSMASEVLPQVRLMDTAVIAPPYIHMGRKAEEYIIYIIKKGTMYLSEEGNPYVLSEGDVFILDPEYSHVGMKASYCEYYYIHMRDDSMRREENASIEEWHRYLFRVREQAIQSNRDTYESCNSDRIILPKRCHLNNVTDMVSLSKVLQEAVAENHHQLEHYKVRCACKVMEALAFIQQAYASEQHNKESKGRAATNYKVKQLVEYLQSKYYEEISGYSIEEVCRCNYDYLNRVFKRQIGVTIFQYLNEIRIQHAKELIVSSSMKISSIAYEVGFQDEGYFSKVFKKYTGITPSGYERIASNCVDDTSGEQKSRLS